MLPGLFCIKRLVEQLQQATERVHGDSNQKNQEEQGTQVRFKLKPLLGEEARCNFQRANPH
jgi:hypothetical protein